MPSPHPTGKPYTWANISYGSAELPTALVELLKPAPRLVVLRTDFEQPTQAGLLGILRTVANAPDHNRNNILFWGANRLFENGYGEDAINALMEAARIRGLPDAESLRAIESARQTST